MAAAARGGQDSFRQDRAFSWQQFSAINFIPNGDLRAGLSTYVGAGLPIQSSAGATITEFNTAGPFNRYLNINQPNLGVSGIVRFRSVALPFKGRYTGTLLIRNAAVGTRTMRLGFNNLFQVVTISNTEWTLFTLTGGTDIAAGEQPVLIIRADDDVSTYDVDVCYASVTFGEGGMPMSLGSPRQELDGASAGFYNPPSIASGGQATTTVTVQGAALGDFAVASFSVDTAGVALTAQVTAANTVTVHFLNLSGAPIDLSSGMVRVRVFKRSY